MATKPDLKIKSRVINVEPDPMHGGRTIVSCEFTQAGDKWIQAFSIITPDRPISLEELKVSLKKQKIERPTDPFVYIKEAMDAKKVFTIGIDTKSSE